MNVLTKVTRRTLSKNRTRTLATIAGVVLSAVMITAVTVSVSSFRAYLLNVIEAANGRWHAAFFNMEAEDRAALEADGRVDSVAWAGVSWAERTREDGEPGYLLVLDADAALLDRMHVRLTAGRMPRTPGEIVLTGQDATGAAVEIGGSVTLALGERVMDGKILGTRDPAVFINGEDGEDLASGETLRAREDRTFTVVGYIGFPSFVSHAPADAVGITFAGGTGAAGRYDAYVLMKDPRDTYDLQRDFLGGKYVSENNENYLAAIGASQYASVNRLLYAFAAVLIGLIVFGSVSLIYNAFSISVSERTKQFGLLRSVGATKKQIRSMVFTEAMTVSAIGIPLGVLSGVLGMAVTFHFLGKVLGNLLSDAVGESAAFALSLRVTPLSLLAAAGVGLATVLVSAWVPSRRAMKISAIEAIRQSEDIKIKPREVRTGKLVYRLFGVEGAIASKHAKRDRKGYRATVMSLVMSVVLFISASTYCRYLTNSVSEALSSYDYDIGYYHSAENGDPDDPMSAHPDAVMDALAGAKSVTGFSAMTRLDSYAVELAREDVPEESVERIFAGNDSEYVRFAADTMVFGVEDGVYRAYLKEHGLSEDEFMGENPKLVVRAVVRTLNEDTGRLEKTQLLRKDKKTLELSFPDEAAREEFLASDEYAAMTPEDQELAGQQDFFIFRRTYEIGAMLEDLPLGLNGGYGYTDIVVLMPMSEAEKVSRSAHSVYEMYFTVSDRENGLRNLLDAAGAAGFPLNELDFGDFYGDTASERGIVTVVRVVSYGFIALISLIAALNVFNTISTNIRLRRREFAALRSVGMTNRGLDRMMCFECLLYGVRSLLYGLPAAFAVTYLLYRAVLRAMDTAFILPWGAVTVAVGSVFLVVFLSMLYAMSGIKKDDPMEAMRAEAI